MLLQTVCFHFQLNKFNPMGDTLASGMGFNILIWNQEEMAAKKHEHLLKAMTNEEIEPWQNRGLEAGVHPDVEGRGRQTLAQANWKAKLMSGEL